MGSGHKIGLSQMTETARNPRFLSLSLLFFSQAPLNGDLGPLNLSLFLRFADTVSSTQLHPLNLSLRT